MSLTKTKEEIEILKEAGRRIALVFDSLEKRVLPGVLTEELDRLAEMEIRKTGDAPAFLGYQPDGAKQAYPATLCVSVNDEVVHGLPGKRALKDGDIVGLDLGLIHRGLVIDMAKTFPVGKISAEDEVLIEKTKVALYEGIKAARAEKRIGAIGNAIEKIGREKNYGVVEILGGHGVGHKVHEAPYIPNYGNPDDGPEIKEGMVLAIEPMFNLGTKHVFLDQDGFTYKTRDGKKSAHFEHTIAIVLGEPVILTESAG